MHDGTPRLAKDLLRTKVQLALVSAGYTKIHEANIPSNIPRIISSARIVREDLLGPVLHHVEVKTDVGMRMPYEITALSLYLVLGTRRRILDVNLRGITTARSPLNETVGIDSTNITHPSSTPQTDSPTQRHTSSHQPHQDFHLLRTPNPSSLSPPQHPTSSQQQAQSSLLQPSHPQD
jgi:hypothetical protein